MGISFWQIAIVVVLVVLLFGRGKISSLMGDLAKGIKSFKKGMSSDDSNQTKIQPSEEKKSEEEISNDIAREDSNLTIHKGIAKRYFSKSFTIADDVKIEDAELKDGLLKIYLMKIVPEGEKPKKITVK